MESLAKNWLTEGIIDFEYKKYILLAYLKNVHEHFEEKKLYPVFSELIGHFRYIKEIKESGENFKANFKKPIESIDSDTFSVKYKNPEDEEWLKEMKEIITFSIPLMVKEIMDGKAIYDFAEKNILVEQIGIQPLNKTEGYFMLQSPFSTNLNVYNYSLSPISYMDEKAFGLKTEYVNSYQVSVSMPVDKIKQELIYENPYLPNPAVYLFKATTNLPSEETFLPIAKRILFTTLSVQRKI